MGVNGGDVWNHSVQYHRLVLRAVPAGCRRALDVGCGEGQLVRALNHVVPSVAGLDIHAPAIDTARTHHNNAHPDGVEYLVGDVLDENLELGSFDLVCSVGALHHFDAHAGLARMAGLLRPGGRLAVIGFARSTTPIDLAYAAAATIATRLHRLTKTYQSPNVPKVWPPPHSYRQMRRLAAQELPGSTFRRLLLWRYSLTWTKPTT